MIYMITLRKTKAPDSYSGAFASYDVLKNGIKIGELIPRTSRLKDVDPYHELRNLNGKSVNLPVAVRGPFRKMLNNWAENEKTINQET